MLQYPHLRRLGADTLSHGAAQGAPCSQNRVPAVRAALKILRAPHPGRYVPRPQALIPGLSLGMGRSVFLRGRISSDFWERVKAALLREGKGGRCSGSHGASSGRGCLLHWGGEGAQPCSAAPTGTVAVFAATKQEATATCTAQRTQSWGSCSLRPGSSPAKN